MTSAQANRIDVFQMSNSFDKRISVTAAQSRTPPKLFSPQQMENIRLTNLRQKRRQLQEKLKTVSNRLNFKKKKEEQQLRKFIRSQQKSSTLIDIHKYKIQSEKFKEMFEQKKQFQFKKKAKQVQDAKTTNQRRLSFIYQDLRNRKLEESEKVRNMKKMDEQNIKYSRQVSFSMKRQQCEAINKMKQRQNSKKRSYWFQKRMDFQQKLLEQAKVYEKYIKSYEQKIIKLRQNQEKLRLQQAQAQQILKCAQQNYQLLRQS